MVCDNKRVRTEPDLAEISAVYIFWSGASIYFWTSRTKWEDIRIVEFYS